MNYADLFRVTLPETALEIAALLVLVVDLGFLRKAAHCRRAVAVAALLGVAGCAAALWAVQFEGRVAQLSRAATILCWARADTSAWRKSGFWC